ncbi:MAG: flagellar basal body-associated protein FliL [Halanaerobiales bacterium]
MADENNSGINMKTLIILMIVMIIITGIFSYLFMSFLAPGNQGSQEVAAPEEETEEVGPTYTLGEFVVNLSGSRGYQYIKANIVVEVDEKAVIEELDRRNPQIRDLIISTLREQQIEDIEAPGASVIKSQIMNRVNGVLNSGNLINVWFTQLVVQ